MHGIVPRYHQLKAILHGQVRSGAWQPGDLIPSERELSDRYGVSRMTARQSVTELVHAGVLYRRQGKGTYVAWPRIAQGLTNLTGFTEDMRARGMEPGTRVLGQRMWATSETEAVRLQIRPGQRVCEVRRLRLADNEPLAVERSLISFFGCEQLLEADLSHQSLYALLETAYGLVPCEAEQEIEAGLADDDHARTLGVAVDDPVLLLRRTTFAERGQPIEYAESVYRGDKYTLHARLARAPAAR